MPSRKIIISGARGVGKSTLIRHLLSSYKGSIGGFATKKQGIDETGSSPIYINPIAGKQEYTPEHIVGHCKDGRISSVETHTFDTLGCAYLAPACSLLIMDELGFLEKDARVFQQAVIARLEGGGDIIAAIKDRRDVPFLERIRTLSGITLIELTEDNREMMGDYLSGVFCS